MTEDSETPAIRAIPCPATGSYDNKKAVHRTAECVIGRASVILLNFVYRMPNTL
ncbi:MAG: hypothetical protein PHX61_13665 [Alphaproteobacteria bacterium]|nr:hypothetical protein [Alphaproteobacteria bacterium]